MNFKPLALLFVFALMANTLFADPILNIDQPIRTLKVSSEQMKNAIVNAAQEQKWVVTSEGEGQMSATYHERDYMAKIAIKYAPTFYTINYADSERMRYKGTSIHPTYNKLIKALQVNIIRNLKAGNFGTQAGATVVALPTAVTCEKTFVIEGDLWNGRVFKGERQIDKILKMEAVTQAAGIVLADGFIINSSSPELGMISASETKSDGRVFPLNIIFSDSGSGVLGKISISTPAGSSSSADTMKAYMCGLINKVESTGNSAKATTPVTTQAAAVPDKEEDDVRTKLVKIKKLHEDGLITQKEYDAKRKTLIEAY